jgi:hypothetical protein
MCDESAMVMTVETTSHEEPKMDFAFRRPHVDAGDEGS